MRVRYLGALVVVGLLVRTVAVGDSGIFRTACLSALPSSPTDMVIGDFNLDGAVDVATTNSGVSGGEVTVSIGFNDCTLSNVAQISVGNFPSAMVLANFDQDQIEDLVVANANDEAIVFLKGRGDNQFFDAPPQLIPIGESPGGMAYGDLDGDGNLDIVTGNEGASDATPGSVSILLGGGDGSFELCTTLEEIGLGTKGVAVGDLNNDQDLDIVAVNTRENSFQVFLGDGTREDGNCVFAFLPAVDTQATPQGVSLADIDDDQLLDVLIADSNQDSVSVYLGNGNGMFDPRMSFAVGNTPGDVLAALVDQDAVLDVLVSNTRSSDVSLLRGTGNTTLLERARTFVVDAEPRAVGVGDIDNDGQVDVVAACEGAVGPSIAVLLNRGGNTLHGVEDVPAGSGPAAVGIGDIDNDALPDVVVASEGGNIHVLLASGEGTFRAPLIQLVGGRILDIVVVDLDQDGRLDVAAVDNDNAEVAVLPGQAGGTFGQLQRFAVGADPAGITAGDFNGDNLIDLAVAVIGPPGQASVLLQQADGAAISFAPAQSTAVGMTPVRIAAIDADCDGLDDLLVVNQGSEEEVSGEVSVLVSNGDGGFTASQTLGEAEGVGLGPLGLTVADLNRDGNPDFAITNTVVPIGSPSARTFFGNCDGLFTAGSTVRAGNLVSAVTSRDVTGDQLVDLVLVNQTANAVRVLSGREDARFAANLPDGVSRMPIDVEVADFDADGWYDVVTANSDPSANNVSVLTNCLGEPFPCRTLAGAVAARRGDANDDGLHSGADLVAVAAEVMDGDGQQVEAIAMGSQMTAPGADANGDGLVNRQDRTAVARYIFGGV